MCSYVYIGVGFIFGIVVGYSFKVAHSKEPEEKEEL